MKKLIPLITIFVLSCLVWPVKAQDPLTPEQLELVEYLAMAFSNLEALDTVTLTVEQSTTQDIEVSQGALSVTIHQELTQVIDGQAVIGKDGDSTDSSMVLNQLIVSDIPGQGRNELTMQMEMVVFDGIIYAKVDEVSPNFPLSLPEDWVNLSEDPSALPGLESFNFETLADLSNVIGLVYELNEDTVLSIEELPEETIDDVSVRVFELEIDTLAALGGDDFNVSSMFNAEAMGIDVDEFFADMLEGTTAVVQIWIGVDDQLPYRLEAAISTDMPLSIQGTNGSLVQEVITTTTYFAFNEPVTIEAPITE